MSSVSGELDRGTAALVLAQPVTRGAFLGAKLTAIAVVLAIATLLAGIAAFIYTDRAVRARSPSAAGLP